MSDDPLAPLAHVWAVLQLARGVQTPETAMVRDAGRAVYCERMARSFLEDADRALERMGLARDAYEAARDEAVRAAEAAEAWQVCAVELARRAASDPLTDYRVRHRESTAEDCAATE